jgi:hypothetical protein
MGFSQGQIEPQRRKGRKEELKDLFFPLPEINGR